MKGKSGGHRVWERKGGRCYEKRGKTKVKEGNIKGKEDKRKRR